MGREVLPKKKKSGRKRYTKHIFRNYFFENCSFFAFITNQKPYFTKLSKWYENIWTFWWKLQSFVLMSIHSVVLIESLILFYINFKPLLLQILQKVGRFMGHFFLLYKEHSVIDNCKDQLSLWQIVFLLVVYGVFLGDQVSSFWFIYLKHKLWLIKQKW